MTRYLERYKKGFRGRRYDDTIFGFAEEVLSVWSGIARFSNHVELEALHRSLMTQLTCFLYRIGFQWPRLLLRAKASASRSKCGEWDLDHNIPLFKNALNGEVAVSLPELPSLNFYFHPSTFTTSSISSQRLETLSILLVQETSSTYIQSSTNNLEPIIISSRQRHVASDTHPTRRSRRWQAASSHPIYTPCYRRRQPRGCSTARTQHGQSIDSATRHASY